MKRPPPRRHLRALAAVVALAALVLGACGSVEPYAARVNGETISTDELNRELEAIRSNAAYLRQVEQDLAQQGEAVAGAGLGTFDTAFVARVLNRRIALELVSQEVRRRKLAVTDEDLEQARQQLAGSIGDEKVLRSFPADYREELVRGSAEVAVLQRALSDTKVDAAAIAAFYAENPALFRQSCIRHILVESREKADQVKARIAAGEDFAAVARTESRDNQGPGGGSAGRGGSLGCLSEEDTAGFVPEFAQALSALQPGQVSDPVQTQYGFHLIQVTERRTRTLEESQAEIGQRLQSEAQGPFSDFLTRAMANARVVVNPRYGRFVKGRDPGVRPNSEATTTTGRAAPRPSRR